MIESLAQALVAITYKGTSTSLHRDIHVLFVAIATKLLELPGNHQMQAVLDLHMILDYMELSEKLRCRASSTCTAIRDAQVALFDGELDVLTTKMSNPSGFRLRSTASYLASATYFTSGNYSARKFPALVYLHSKKFFQFSRRLASRAIMGPVRLATRTFTRICPLCYANRVKES